MVNQIMARWRRGPARGVLAAGYLLVALGVVGVVLGLMLIDSLTADFRASLRVSRSAVASVGETVEVVEDVALATADSIGSISRTASSTAAATDAASDGLANIARFLNQGLPADIEAIQSALPGAIDAADAVDTTLSALSLFGVDYAPEEAFGESLRGVEDTLRTLPTEIRRQGSSVQALVPLADTLAGDVAELAGKLDGLEASLIDVQLLADSYRSTIEEAESAVVGADRSLNRTVLLLRVVLALAAAGSITTGLALVSIHRILSIEPAAGAAVVEKVSTS